MIFNSQHAIWGATECVQYQQGSTQQKMHDSNQCFSSDPHSEFWSELWVFENSPKTHLELTNTKKNTKHKKDRMMLPHGLPTNCIKSQNALCLFTLFGMVKTIHVRSCFNFFKFRSDLKCVGCFFCICFLCLSETKLKKNTKKKLFCFV